MWQAIALLGSKLLSNRDQKQQQQQQLLSNAMNSNDESMEDLDDNSQLPAYDNTKLDWEKL